VWVAPAPRRIVFAVKKDVTIGGRVNQLVLAQGVQGPRPVEVLKARRPQAVRDEHPHMVGFVVFADPIAGGASLNIVGLIAKEGEAVFIESVI
jgi:hypothetical protein